VSSLYVVEPGAQRSTFTVPWSLQSSTVLLREYSSIDGVRDSCDGNLHGSKSFSEEHSTIFVSEEVATVWLAQLITSVKHTQSRGIIHRDLKLENIFLDHNGNAIIGDFAVSLMFPKLLFSNNLQSTKLMQHTPHTYRTLSWPVLSTRATADNGVTTIS